MTNSAGGKFPTRRRLTVRRVAGVALDMGRHACGNRQRRGASTTAAMAGRTSTGRPGGAVHMLRVIEFDVETFIKLRRETFQGRVATVDVRMTDNTHRDGGSHKLPSVASDTGFVSRKNWRCRVVFALMTGSAGERCVTLTRVLEV